MEDLAYREGPLTSRKIRNVCKTHCNNGWMSTLEKRAKPIAAPLLGSQPTILTLKNQKILATWIAMKLMVAEHVYKAGLSITQFERTHVMIAGEPPKNWKIWISHVRGPRWQSGMIILPTRIMPVMSTRLEPDGNTSPDTKLITFGIGELLISAICTTIGFQMKLQAEVERYLRPIWPPAGEFFWPPGRIFSDAGAILLVRSLERALIRMRPGRRLSI